MVKAYFAKFMAYCKIISLSENSINNLLKYIRQLEKYYIHLN